MRAYPAAMPNVGTPEIILLFIVAIPLVIITIAVWAALRRNKPTQVGPPTPPPPLAGWYPDPQVPGVQRYWDGRAWGPTAPPPSAGGL